MGALLDDGQRKVGWTPKMEITEADFKNYVWKAESTDDPLIGFCAAMRDDLTLVNLERELHKPPPAAPERPAHELIRATTQAVLLREDVRWLKNLLRATRRNGPFWFGGRMRSLFEKHEENVY